MHTKSAEVVAEEEKRAEESDSKSQEIIGQREKNTTDIKKWKITLELKKTATFGYIIAQSQIISLYIPLSSALANKTDFMEPVGVLHEPPQPSLFAIFLNSNFGRNFQFFTPMITVYLMNLFL